MREQTSLTKQFDEQQEIVAEPLERTRREGERDPLVLKSFKLPVRNWELLIDDYNSANKRKFPFTALQCKVLIEYVKRGIPPKYLFKTIGISSQAFGNLTSKANELETKLNELGSKDSLSEEEFDTFNQLLRNPYRILLSDISRAEGLADLFDWESFNEMARVQPDVLMAKMRSKFKDVFSDKDQAAQGVNIQINLGGDWISEL